MSYGGLNNWMDAAAEIGRNPVRMHQIQPEYGDEQTGAGRDCRSRFAKPKPNPQARTGTGKHHFSLFSVPQAGLVTLPVVPFLTICDDHTYIDAYSSQSTRCTKDTTYTSKCRCARTISRRTATLSTRFTYHRRRE